MADEQQLVLLEEAKVSRRFSSSAMVAASDAIYDCPVAGRSESGQFTSPGSAPFPGIPSFYGHSSKLTQRKPGDEQPSKQGN
jgi:hypothetical protein